MAIPVTMPVFGMSAQEATVQQWLKAEGEPVRKGEPLLLVETEKATMEVPAPADGRLARILVREGQTVPVQTPIAELAEDGEAAPAAPTPSGWIKATPLARKTARELGLDLRTIVATGPGGRIVERDVRAAAASVAPAATAAPAAAQPAPPVAPSPAPAAPPEAPPSPELVPLSRVRAITAERMALSARSVARVTLFAETDFTEASRFRQQLGPEFERRWGARLTYDAMLARAAARALARHPDANSQWADGALRRNAEVNVGVAIQTERGLLVPVLHRANQLSLPQLARELNRLFEAARAGRLTPREMSGGSFTITNLGAYGVDAFTPIVNPPEAAILGVGRIATRPVWTEGAWVPRETAWLSLSFDHRVLDGVPAAQFLADLREAIEKPYLLLAE